MHFMSNGSDSIASSGDLPNDLSETFAARNATLPQRTNIIVGIDKLFQVLSGFNTEEELRAPENVAVLKAAFQQFLQDAQLQIAPWAFDILLQDKSGEDYFRKDGITPNWHHELKIIVSLLGLISSGKLSEEAIEKYGGLDVLITAALWHDKSEDFGPESAKLEEFILKKFPFQRAEAHQIGKIVGLCSHKEVVMEGDGITPKRDENGVIVTRRVHNDMKDFYEGHLQDPFAVLIKYADSIEGASTRPGVARFNTEKNRRYYNDRFHFYLDWQNRTGDEFPDLRPAFLSLDGQLGVALQILDAVTLYEEKPHLDPASAKPIDVLGYTLNAQVGFQYVPNVMRPDMTIIHRYEQLAASDPRLAMVLERAIYPSVITLIGDRRGTLLSHTQDYDVGQP